MVDKLDRVFELSALTLLIVWLFLNGLQYQIEYPTKMVELYSEPWWRILLVCLVLTAFAWSPSVGILLAFAVIMYISDLNSLTK